MKYESNVGLLIGIPTLYRPTTIEWALALRGQTCPINYNATMLILPNYQIADARNIICEEALKLNTRYLYFIGDDTEPPLHALRQFIFRMEQMPELGVVGGIYCTKSDPPAPLVFRGNGAGSYWDWKVGEFFEVSGLGMDCTLIRTEMLRSLPKPWFKTIDSDDFLGGRNYAEMWTEDLYFCKNVLDNTTYKIYADATVLPKHWDAINHKYYTLPSNSLPTRRISVGEGVKTLLDIGCGETRNEFEGYEITRVDIREDVNPDYRCDVRQLPFGDESYDAIFSSHVLEHFSRQEHIQVMKEWLRVVKTGGEVFIVVPSIKWAADVLAQSEISPEDEMHMMNVFYGGQTNPYDFHKVGFTPSSLRTLFESLNITVTDITEGPKYNITIKGTKNGNNG